MLGLSVCQTVKLSGINLKMSDEMMRNKLLRAHNNKQNNSIILTVHLELTLDVFLAQAIVVGFKAKIT